MKRNKKAIYEQIMKNVSKHVKRALLEYETTVTHNNSEFDETSSDDYYEQPEVKYADIFYDGKYHPKDNKTLCDLVRQLMLEEDIMDLNCIDVSRITDFSYVFADNSGLPWIDIDEWDVSNGTNFEGMFMDCPHFNADLSRWDVSNGVNFSNMFFNCRSFDSDLRYWQPYYAEDTTKMFCDCESIDCDFRQWNMRNLKFADQMFDNCRSLRVIPQWYKLYQFKNRKW